jgi:hypothetical protein
MPLIPALIRLKQERVKARLGYIVRACLKTKQTTKKPQIKQKQRKTSAMVWMGKGTLTNLLLVCIA